MAVEKARQMLEAAAEETLPTPSLAAIPSRFYESFVLRGLKVEAAEPRRLLCSFSVPPRLLNTGKFMHGGATASLVDLIGSAVFYTAGVETKGTPLEMSIAYLDSAFSNEEIEIEARVLRTGKAVGVATVELRKKNGKLIAHARYTKYLAPSSNL